MPNGNLTLASTAGLSFSIGSGTNAPSMQFSGTLGSINAALNGITFTPPIGFNGDAGGTVPLSISINDLGNTGLGGPQTASGTLNIKVQPDHPATVTTTLSSPLNYFEGNGTEIVDPNLTVTDLDGRLLTGATVQISNNYASGEDVLGFTASSGITGTFSNGILTLTGSASAAAYQTVLRSVTYTDLSQNPSQLTRTISFSANDGILPGATSADSISVTAVNTPPNYASLPSILNIGQNGTVIMSTANNNVISVADVDADGGQEQVTLLGLLRRRRSTEPQA